MAAVCLDGCSRLKEILQALPELPPHNWLISALECFVEYSREGDVDWEAETLFLSDAELRREMEIDDQTIIWGAFSALPAGITEEAAFSYDLPWLDGNTASMREHLVPQHPLAYLEIAVCDGCYTVVSARDAALLEPLYALPYPARDEERDNRKLNDELRRIRTVLKTAGPEVSEELANEVQWICWYRLFRESEKPVEDSELLSALQEALAEVTAPGYQCRRTIWNPFHAD